MKYDTIEVHIEKNIATVYLDRSEVHNAMNEKLMKELTTCFKELSKDNNIRVIILTGKGKSFCAGADLNWMKSMAKYSAIAQGFPQEEEPHGFINDVGKK